MRTHHVGDLVVVETREYRRVPVGMLTDRDLVIEIIAEGVDSNAVSVGDVMTLDPVTALESDDLLDVIELMRAKGIRRVPVVNVGDGLVGLLAVDDVIDLLADLLTDISKLVVRQQKRESETRS
jgi:CBS domain-containing protein